jgi:hypothetical protein
MAPQQWPILVYASTQQISTDANLTAGYLISLKSPTKCPNKQENLESCLAMARIKMEKEYGSSTDAHFALQISTEVNVENLDKFAPDSMARNPHFYSEQEDRTLSC